MNALKACPFCGGAARTVLNSDDIETWAQCTTKKPHRCPMSHTIIPIEEWNRRTQPEATAPAVPSCRMQGGICACRSGGSFGGCAIERGIVHRGFVERPTAPAQDLSAAILARQIIQDTNDTLREQSEGLRQLKAENDQLRALLASSANALSAGDRVDALAVLKSIIEDGYLSDTNTARGHAILQSQKGDSDA